MADEDDVEQLQQGVGAWNEWRKSRARPNLVQAGLRGSDLSGANLSGANLSYADLSSANLRYANLSGANLSYADLTYGDLSRANLTDGDLTRASMWDCNLRYADLSRAKLCEASLSNSDLSGANLTGTESDRLAPSQCAATPAMRQRLRRDAEIAAGKLHSSLSAAYVPAGTGPSRLFPFLRSRKWRSRPFAHHAHSSEDRMSAAGGS